MRLALILGVVVLAACGRDRPGERRMLGLIRAPEVVRDEPVVREGTRQMFQEAKNHLRDGRWQQAKELLQQIAHESPQFGNGMVEQYLARASREVTVAEHLNRAVEYLDQHQYVLAAEALGRIEAHDTLQSDRVGEVRDRLDAVAKGLVESGYARMRGPKGLTEMEELRDIATTLEKLEPGNADAAVMSAFSEPLLKELEKSKR